MSIAKDRSQPQLTRLWQNALYLNWLDHALNPNRGSLRQMSTEKFHTVSITTWWNYQCKTVQWR